MKTFFLYNDIPLLKKIICFMAINLKILCKNFYNSDNKVFHMLCQRIKDNLHKKVKHSNAYKMYIRKVKIITEAMSEHTRKNTGS